MLLTTASAYPYTLEKTFAADKYETETNLALNSVYEEEPWRNFHVAAKACKLGRHQHS